MEKYRKFENETDSRTTPVTPEVEHDPPPAYTSNPYRYPGNPLDTVPHPDYVTNVNNIEVQMAPITTQPGMDTETQVTDVVVTEEVQDNNMDAYIAFSIVVCICFSPVFGCIAAIVACGGQTATRRFAKKSGIASIIINVVGICVSIVLIVILTLTNSWPKY